jgi:KUP system potassium uptake protein
MFSGSTGDPLDLPAERITAVTLRYGFLDQPDIPSALRLAAADELIGGAPDIDEATYFLSQITIVPTDAPGMSTWRKKLFLAMARNAVGPAEYFKLPDDQTVTMSGRIDL